MRRAFLVRATSAVATTTVFSTTPLTGAQRTAMEAEFGVTVGWLPDERRSPLRPWRHLTRFALPRVVALDDRRGQREALRAWASDYDVAVIHHLDNFLLLRPVLRGPIVLDLDDIESVVVGQRVRNLWVRHMRVSRGGRLGGLPAPLQRWVVRLRRAPRLVHRTFSALLDWPGWQRGERLALAGCDRILVCSEEDRALLGAAEKIVVVPNGYDLEGPPAGDAPRGEGTTLGFWGSMSYPPNTDGANWLVNEILPKLRELLPEARVKLIGRGGERLAVATAAGVEATGVVPDMAPALASVDVAVVPLRMGGGTRIKIVEAWANHIPVVSTSVGAYGLRDGNEVDLLLADDPADFARAVHRVLTDPELRRHLVKNGEARAAGLTWQVISDRLSPMLAALAGATAAHRGSTT